MIGNVAPAPCVNRGYLCVGWHAQVLLSMFRIVMAEVFVPHGQEDLAMPPSPNHPFAGDSPRLSAGDSSWIYSVSLYFLATGTKSIAASNISIANNQ